MGGFALAGHQWLADFIWSFVYFTCPSINLGEFEKQFQYFILGSNALADNNGIFYSSTKLDFFIAQLW
jgi:hypothetical protein